MGDAQVKFTLDERDIPTHWVNLMADLPGNAPPAASRIPTHPGARRP
jgi:tryptophan synthase beta chain